MTRRRSLLCAALLLCSTLAHGEFYYYRAPDGHTVLTDRPIKEAGYDLVEQRSTVPDGSRSESRAPAPVPTGSPPEIHGYIARASARYRVDPTLVEAIIQVESDFDSFAISKRGAAGLMQLMEDTADRYRIANRFNAEQNIDVGVRHLRELLNRYRGDLQLALAAYNAGTNSVDRYGGVPPFPETREYISKVLSLQEQIRRLQLGKR